VTGELKHELFDPLKIIEIAKAAGSEILEVYGKKDFKIEIKEDDSPVTEADFRSNNVILQGLRSHVPAIPIISEETEMDKSASIKMINDERRFWLVDPLDGTKGFINRTDEFCVCIGFVEDGVAKDGFIFDPVNKISYIGLGGLGAFKEENGKIEKINVRKTPESVSVFMSKNHKGGEGEIVDKIWENNQKHFESSALKFCHIASGKADVYFRTNPTSLWDTAAGQAIVTAAGGKVVTFDSFEMKYVRDSLINPGFIVSSTEKLTEELIAGIVDAGIN
jgi:3'(2'), 5'-bisphosphate nucleotidase